MHLRILEDATLEQLKEYVDDVIKYAKTNDEKYYDSLEMCLYKKVYGYHFSDWMLKKALEKLENEDGTVGAHWNLEDTTSVAKQFEVVFKDFDKYDWCYVMNMLYSDYFGAVPNETNTYVKLAKKFLQDKDADPGKAFRYYVAMNYDEL